MNKNSTYPIHLLIVEDSEDDTLLLVRYLEAKGLNFEWRRVETEDELVSTLKGPCDIVLSDFSMPTFNGFRILEIVRMHDQNLPFIFVSGTMCEEVAVQAMKSGAQDFVLKGHLGRLLPILERELREIQLRAHRQQAEQTLRKLSQAVEQAADSIFITDPSGRIEYVNPAFEKMTGYLSHEAQGSKPSILRSGHHDDAFYQEVWTIISRENAYRGIMINRRKNGELFHEEKLISALKNEKGEITHFVSTGRDITARIQAEETSTRLATVLEATPDLVAIFEPEGRFHYLNRAGRRLLGLEPHTQVESLGFEEVFPERMVYRALKNISKKQRSKDSWTGESVLRNRSGESIPISLILLTHHNADGSIGYLSSIARDISERKHFEASIQYKATHDELTDLPNRFLLIDRFKSALERAKSNRTCVAVLFLDLNNFKRVNDSLGHDAGDSLLQKVGNRIRSGLRPNDTLARHGGDEYTILVEDLANAESVISILQRLLSLFEKPIIIGAQEVYVTFSTGIAVYPHDGDKVDDLLRHADTAMYQAKSTGSNQYRFYAPEMNARGHEFLTLEADLRRALDRNEFILHYQPQIDIRSGKIAGVEGLIRWQHPSRGLVSPADFIPLLENSGLITAVGEWVLRQACALHRTLRQMGSPECRISINVSAVQFKDEYLLDKIRAALRDESMPAEKLEIEITENVVMHDPLSAAEVLQALHALGVRTAVDDFGTGYSSLAYLKRFPLNVLKIDRTFVADIGNNNGNEAIVEASISLAHKLGLEIVAEGVETLEQLNFLSAHECDLAQGYYLSRPLPTKDFLESVKKAKSDQFETAD